MKTKEMHTHRIMLDQALTFITAGEAVFTVKSGKSGKHLTYKVSAPDDTDKDDPRILFVETKEQGENNFGYLGFMRRDISNQWMFYYGSKSSYKVDGTEVKVFHWLVNVVLYSGRTDDTQAELWHEGKCCRCGKALTVPESIESGIGPECTKIKLRTLNADQRKELRKVQKQKYPKVGPRK